MSDEQQPAPPAVRLEHVSKSFGWNEVLKDVSIAAPSGRRVMLGGRAAEASSIAGSSPQVPQTIWKKLPSWRGKFPRACSST